MLLVPTLLVLAIQDEPATLPSTEIAEHPTTISHLALSSDGDVLFTADERGGFQAWDLAKGESLWAVEEKMPKVTVDAGKDLVTFHHGMAMVSFLDARTGESKTGIGGLAFLDKGKSLAVAGGRKTVTVFDLKDL